MTDTQDSVTLAATINNPNFQDRCRQHFVTAAVNVMNEVLSVFASAPSAPGTAVLHLQSAVGVAQGMTVSSLFSPSTIPVGAIVETVAGSDVTLNVKVQNQVGGSVGGTGVQTGDVIQIAAISHGP